MRCEFCGAGFDTRAGLSSHARAHLRDFGITNWELTISPINILKELLANSSQHPMLQSAVGTEPSSPNREREMHGFGYRKSMTPMSECSIPRSPLSPFPPAWGDESMQSFRDGKQVLNLPCKLESVFTANLRPDPAILTLSRIRRRGQFAEQGSTQHE